MGKSATELDTWKSEGAGAHGKTRNWIGHGNPMALAPMGKSTTGSVFAAKLLVRTSVPL
jgi:hypothetical protein